MSKKVKHQESTTEEVFKNLEVTASKSERFVEENKNIIIGAVLAIVIVIGGYMAYNDYYLAPLQKEATNELFNAKQYFEKGSYDTALKGDGQYLGLLDIADDYSMTKSGNVANYYAGLSYLKLGKYDEAITYLEKFSSDDKMVGSVAKGAIGDAFVGLNQLDDALDYYVEAANTNENDFTTPLYLMKAGNTAMELKKFSKAQDLFERIKNDFSKSAEAQSIDKFIERAIASQK
jgi:tetratricopeptide (TPR) repeat protein